MSSDLSTGRTPAAHTKGGLSVHMAPAAGAIFGTQVSPEEYRKRKVALLTGQCLPASSRPPPLAPLPPPRETIVPLVIATCERG